MPLPQIERILRSLGAIAGLITLAIALVATFLSIRQTPGREEPGARIALRGPILVLGASLFIAIGTLLWIPLPVQLEPSWQAIAVLAGSLVLFAGLAVYLWGLFSLRGMFAPSSAFGVRLHANHALVTAGPYAYVRHPMYLAVIVAALGSLLLYQTWATLLFAVGMFGLDIRAAREERVLAAEFGIQWEAYASTVPRWLPRFRRGRKRGA